MNNGDRQQNAFRSMHMPNELDDNFTYSSEAIDSETMSSNGLMQHPGYANRSDSSQADMVRHLKDKPSYSDYYQVTTDTNFKSASHSQVANDDRHTKPAEMAEAYDEDVNSFPPLVPDDARPVLSDDQLNNYSSNANSGKLMSLKADPEALQFDSENASHFERAMTSPLSSVPSDLDERDHKTAKIISKVHPRGRGRPARENHSSGVLDSNDRTTSHGRKRGLAGSDGRPDDKRIKKNKKIKISSPTKQRKDSPVELGIMPQDPRAKSKAEAEARIRSRDDDQGSNDGHCSACQGTGKLLCCDDCPRSFHFTCIEPPIEEADIPDEPYFCMSCWDKRYGFPRPPPGLFNNLLTNEITRDPSMFSLPLEIRDFFENGELGVYQETMDQKMSLRKDKFGLAEEADPFRLRDKQNRPILCYKCGHSALGSAGILSCDHCSAHWHFDCLNPPLHGPPAVHKKWMCPLHVHDVLPSNRRPRTSGLVDVSLRRGFKNNGAIEVELSDIENSEHSESDSSDDEQLDPTGILKDFSRVKFRLPSRGIILDFLDTCRDKKTAEGQKLLDALTIGGGSATTFQALIDVAMEELAYYESHSRESDFASEHAERVQLLALKTLIEVKGRDKLLEFLNTA